MTEAVKTMGKTTKRAEQARATRQRIIECARQLFLGQGYAATTLDQVAAAAGVAVQTVYFHFGNKRTVLKEVMDVAAVGDDEPVPLLDRPWIQAVRDEPDPRRAVGIWLETSRAIFGRVAPLLSVVRDAAGTDPEMAEQWRANEEQRYIAHRSMAELLAAKGDALRPGLTVDEAADVVFTLLSPEVYLLLTVVRGWPPARWQDWAADTIARAILRLPMMAACKRPVAMRRPRRADQHVFVWLQHTQPGQGRYQRKRANPYISVAHPLGAGPAGGRVAGQPAAAAPPGQRGAHRGQVPGPRCRGEDAERGGEHLGECAGPDSQNG